MGNKDFKLISKDRYPQFSMTNRIIFAIMYIVFIVRCFLRLYDEFDLIFAFPQTLMIIIDIIGIVTFSILLISPILGRNLFFKPVYIEINNDLIKYKKGFKKEIKISNVQIEYIRIIDNKLIFKIFPKKKLYFNIYIFDYPEKGHLKFKLQEFCKLNDIEFKQK